MEARDLGSVSPDGLGLRVFNKISVRADQGSGAGDPIPPILGARGLNVDGLRQAVRPFPSEPARQLSCILHHIGTEPCPDRIGRSLPGSAMAYGLFVDWSVEQSNGRLLSFPASRRKVASPEASPN